MAHNEMMHRAWSSIIIGLEWHLFHVSGSLIQRRGQRALNKCFQIWKEFSPCGDHGSVACQLLWMKTSATYPQPRHKWPPNTFPASREMLDRRWANVVTYVGATSANDVGPTWICPSVHHWHNVVTPTMTLFQRFAKVITYCILLYLMVGTTFAHCLYEWLAKHWHNFIIAHCLSTITIKITSFNCGIIVGLITVLTNKQHKAVNSGQIMWEGGNSHTKYKV